MDFQEQQVTKGTQECQGEEENLEDLDSLEFTKGSPVEVGSLVLLDPQALQAPLG